MRHFNRRGKTATPPTRGHLPGTSSPATCQPVNTALRGGTWSPGFPVSTDSLHTLSTEAGGHFLHGLPTPSCTLSRDALRPGMWGPSSGVQSPDRPLPNTHGALPSPSHRLHSTGPGPQNGVLTGASAEGAQPCGGVPSTRICQAAGRARGGTACVSQA